MPETGNNLEIKADIDLIDEIFDISQSESYHLSIQIAEKGLSFCIFNTVISKYIVLRHYPFAGINTLVDSCKKIFETDELLQASYKSCWCLEVSSRSTLVPEHFFDSSDAEEYLSFSHGVKKNEQVLHNFVSGAQLYNVFSVPLEIKMLLEEYHPKLKWFHHASPFIEWMILHPQPASPITLYFYGSYMDVLLIKNKQLLLYNTFEVNTPADSIYFLAGVLNLHKMSLSSTSVSYAGELKESPLYVEMIRKYVLRINECEPFSTITYSHYLTESMRKRFINLFNLYGCAS